MQFLLCAYACNYLWIFQGTCANRGYMYVCILHMVYTVRASHTLRPFEGLGMRQRTRGNTITTIILCGSQFCPGHSHTHTKG